jgi:hypothetical protein
MSARGNEGRPGGRPTSRAGRPGTLLGDGRADPWRLGRACPRRVEEAPADGRPAGRRPVSREWPGAASGYWSSAPFGRRSGGPIGAWPALGPAGRDPPWSVRWHRGMSDRTCILMAGPSQDARTCVLIEPCHRLLVAPRRGQPVVFRRLRPGRRVFGAVLASARRGPRRLRGRRQLALRTRPAARPRVARQMPRRQFLRGRSDLDTHAFDRPHARGEV